MLDDIKQHIAEHQDVISSIDLNMIQKIDLISDLLCQAIKNGNTIFWCGNGGSSCDSQHLSAELVGRFDKNRVSLNSVSLASDVAAITCIANDFGFDDIFSRQLEGLGKKNDILVAISTSGKSKNVINAVKKANFMGLITISLMGKNGGLMKNTCAQELIVKSNSTARIQETHILIGHILCDLIEKKLGLVN